MDDPRAHHYNFVFQDLPTIVFELGKDVIDQFKEFDNDYWIKMWDEYGKEWEAEERVSHEGLSVQYIQKDRYEGIVISLPEPKFMPEAYFIFIILERSSDQSVTPRYFTLELGMVPLVNKKRTVFCEISENTHSNMGDGPEPDLDKFISFVEQKIF